MDLLEIFGVKESYQLPDAIMAALLSEKATEYVDAVRDSGISDLRDYYQSDAGDRKKLKQDFTPQCVCGLVAQLLLPGSVLDMCSGTGALGKAAEGHELHCQEFSERTIPFALLDACVTGTDEILDQADCLRGNVEKSYEVRGRKARERAPEGIGKFANVVMNPPYSMGFPDAEDYLFFGMQVPKSKADYGFVLQGLSHMEEGGRLIAVLPNGVLFRGQKEGKIREWLTEQKLIYAVIGLPENLFLNTSIPVCLMVLQKGDGHTLFIDASKEFEKRCNQNVMNPEHAVDAFHKRKDEERYAHLATLEEIRGNGYNLNIPRYVDTYVPEPPIDIVALSREIEEIERNERETKKKLAELLTELQAPAGDAEVIGWHRRILEGENTEGEYQGAVHG